MFNRCASAEPSSELEAGIQAWRQFMCFLRVISASLLLAAITAAPRQNPQASLKQASRHGDRSCFAGYFRFAIARGNNRCASAEPSSELEAGIQAWRQFMCFLRVISASLLLAAITAAPRQNPQASLGFCTRLAGYFTAITSTSARAPLGSAATA